MDDDGGVILEIEKFVPHVFHPRVALEKSLDDYTCSPPLHNYRSHQKSSDEAPCDFLDFCGCLSIDQSRMSPLHLFENLQLIFEIKLHDILFGEAKFVSHECFHLLLVSSTDKLLLSLLGRIVRLVYLQLCIGHGTVLKLPSNHELISQIAFDPIASNPRWRQGSLLHHTLLFSLPADTCEFLHPHWA